MLALRHSWGRYGSRTTPACLLDSIANAGPTRRRSSTLLSGCSPQAARSTKMRPCGLSRHRPARRGPGGQSRRVRADEPRTGPGASWPHDRPLRSAAATAAAVSRGMRALLARRDAALAAGAAPVGWKIGFNTPAIQAHFGLTDAVVGYMADTGVSPDGATVSLAGWGAPAVEVEVAVRVGADGRGRRAGAGARAGRSRHLLRRHRAGPGRQHLPPRRDLRRRGPGCRPVGHGRHGHHRRATSWPKAG